LDHAAVKLTANLEKGKKKQIDSMGRTTFVREGEKRNGPGCLYLICAIGEG